MKPPDFLLPQAQAWRSTFRHVPAKRVALFAEDRFSFAAALLAGWAEGKQMVLPGDVLPATLTALEAQVDAWVGDFPVQPLLAPGLADGAPWPALDRDAEGVVIFTSGSTGQPVAIAKRLRQLLDEVATLEATFGAALGAQAQVFSTVSHQHIYGLLCAVLWPLATGRPLTPRRFEFPEQLEPALAQGPCVLISSPAHLKRLPDAQPWQTQLGAVFSSGGPLPSEAAAKAEAILGHQPIELLGSSETGGIAWRQGPAMPWRPLAGVQIRSSAQGALEVCGPHLPSADWFTTADQVVTTAEGFRLCGRVDRIAKIEEKRVSLDVIEATARQTGLLVEARALVLHEARVGVGLVGVLSAQGRGLTRKALVERLKTALEGVVERVALPRRFRFVDALPVNEQGKTTQALLEPLFAPERPEPRWLERSPTQAQLEMTISPRLRVFDGHFPGAPVVPGVAQLDWAIGWGREAFSETSAKMLRLEAIKFQALMLPGKTVKLALDWNASRATLTFRYTGPNAVYSSGRVVFSP